MPLREWKAAQAFNRGNTDGYNAANYAEAYEGERDTDAVEAMADDYGWSAFPDDDYLRNEAVCGWLIGWDEYESEQES